MDALIASPDGALTVGVGDAQAVFRAHAAPGVHRELVHDAGWSTERFSAWVAAALQRNRFDQDPGPG